MALSEKDKKGVWLIAGVGLVLAGLVGVRLAIGSKPPPAVDGCVGAVTASTVIVLDQSEELTTQTRAEIVARAMAWVNDKAQTNERVTVFAVSEVSRKNLQPTFSRCKPPREGSRAYEDVRGIEKAYKRQFIEPLEQVLNVAPRDGKESPIAQALIDVSLTQYLRTPRNTLLVFSDMLEHTPPKYSMYTCTDPQKSIAQFREARKGAQERPVFRNTAVQLNIIPRLDAPKASLACREAVWSWFFGDNEGVGATIATDPLPGA